MEYGLIGERLGHSFSPQIHKNISDYKYELHEIKRDELERFMKERAFKGINVTIPYKEAIIPMLDYTDEAALATGAVNTVVNREGRLYGYNTDAAGLKALILKSGIEIKNSKVLILGTGGTSKTAVYVVRSLSAREVIRVSRSGREDCVTYEEAYANHADADVIINCTPCGMYPNVNDIPAELTHFAKLKGVIDVIFNPLRSNLVLSARERNIKATGGLYMLAGQAVFASEQFTGDKKEAVMLTDRACLEVLAKVQNIVLIGMPSAGKSTIGRMVAKRLNKTFVDTDDVITERIGCSIREYFERFGEEAFRDIEKKVISEKSVENNLVIATGGGAVLNPDNVRALKRNGVIIMLDRSLDKLTPTESRPLLKNREMLDKLYNERYGIYVKASDAIVDADRTVYENTEQVIKAVDDLKGMIITGEGIC